MTLRDSIYLYLYLYLYLSSLIKSYRVHFNKVS